METWHAADLEEALVHRADRLDATVLAGGTDLMVDLNAGRRSTGDVIALRRVAELRTLERDRIGAGVRWVDLARAPDPGLAQAARTVGSRQVRSMGTIGGNLGTASPAGDGLVVLAALDAQIELVSQRAGIRLVPWGQFLVGPRQTSLAPDELVTAVVLPADRPTRSEFGKVGARGAMTIALVNACVARGHDGRVAIALGSVAPTVVRSRTAEELVSREGGYASSHARDVAAAVRADIAPISDLRATADYRRHAAGVLVTRLLSRVFSS